MGLPDSIMTEECNEHRATEFFNNENNLLLKARPDLRKKIYMDFFGCNKMSVKNVMFIDMNIINLVVVS